MWKKSQKICNLSSIWSAHATSWQSVFGFLYWGAHPDEPGHNHSSSPFTTLADRAEHKGTKHRSRANPTFDQRHDLELIHIRPNSRCRTLPKVFGLYEGGRDNALSNKPLVSRYAQNSDVATCQNASLLLGYTKKPGDVYQQETV